MIPAVQKVKPPLLSESKDKTSGAATNSSAQFDDADLKKALEESKRYIEENDESLKRAIALSMESKCLKEFVVRVYSVIIMASTCKQFPYFITLYF